MEAESGWVFKDDFFPITYISYVCPRGWGIWLHSDKYDTKVGHLDPWPFVAQEMEILSTKNSEFVNARMVPEAIARGEGCWILESTDTSTLITLNTIVF